MALRWVTAITTWVIISTTALPPWHLTIAVGTADLVVGIIGGIGIHPVHSYIRAVMCLEWTGDDIVASPVTRGAWVIGMHDAVHAVGDGVVVGGDIVPIHVYAESNAHCIVWQWCVYNLRD